MTVWMGLGLDDLLERGEKMRAKNEAPKKERVLREKA
jgi:hypothetical protein